MKYVLKILLYYLLMLLLLALSLFLVILIIHDIMKRKYRKTTGVQKMLLKGLDKIYEKIDSLR